MLPGAESEPEAEWAEANAKARALTSGRYHVSFDDIRALAHPVLRHRVLTNFHAESEGITSDSIIDQLLEAVCGLLEAAVGGAGVDQEGVADLADVAEPLDRGGIEGKEGGPVDRGGADAVGVAHSGVMTLVARRAHHRVRSRAHRLRVHRRQRLPLAAHGGQGQARATAP